MTERSQQKYRWLLRRVAIAEGVQRPPRTMPAKKIVRRPPYSPDEQAALWAWASSQHERWRPDLQLLVAASVGAGMEAPDLRTTRGSDVTRLDDGTAVIDIQGLHARRTLRPWEDAVLAAARRAGDSWLYRPDSTYNRDGKNLITAVMARTVNHSRLPERRIDLRRGRTTWIVRLLSAGTPPAVLARAAGLALKSLNDYHAHCTDPDLDDRAEDRLLRDPRLLR